MQVIMMRMIVILIVVYCIVHSREDVGESIVDHDDDEDVDDSDSDSGDSDSNAIGEC